jgi:predicted Zn finger-like uncharacterized protein
MPAVHCPQCQTKFNVAESALGKSARCSKCQHRFVLELPKPAADDADVVERPPVVRFRADGGFCHVAAGTDQIAGGHAGRA